MSEGTKEPSVDEIEHLIDILVTDERTRWYLAGLIDGYQIHHNRQVTK